MRNSTNLPNSGRAFTLGLALLVLQPMLAKAAGGMHVTWDNLQTVSGRTVRLALADGVITGKAVGIEADALVVDVASTTNLRAYPKGLVRVPRQKLHVLEMRPNGTKFRKLFGVVGGLSGFVGGVGAAVYGVEHGDILGPINATADGFVIAGVTAAGTAVGYFVGKARDERWTRIEIEP